MNVANSSGHLMRWRVFFREFDLTVTYKKGAHTTQTNVLSRQLTIKDCLPQIEGEEVTCYAIDPEITDDMAHDAYGDPLWDQCRYLTETSELQSLLLSAPSQEPTTSTFVPITTDDLVREQLGDPFFIKVRAHLNGKELLLFRLSHANGPVCTVENYSQLAIPHSFNLGYYTYRSTQKLVNTLGGESCISPCAENSTGTQWQ